MLRFNAPHISPALKKQNHTMTINPMLLFGAFYFLPILLNTKKNILKNQSPHMLLFNAFYAHQSFQTLKIVIITIIMLLDH